jgi:hypothetical protein
MKQYIRYTKMQELEADTWLSSSLWRYEKRSSLFEEEIKS